MKMYLYCVEDSLSGQVMPPFCSPNDKTAKRDFIFGSLSSQTPIQDLHLWKIGEFDSATSPVEDQPPTFIVKEYPRTLCDPTLSDVEMYSKIFREQFYPEIPELNNDDVKEVNVKVGA